MHRGCLTRYTKDCTHPLKCFSMNTHSRLTSAFASDSHAAPRSMGLLVLLSILCVQCVQIDGGATEFNWSLRTIAGNVVNDCTLSNVAKIRLCWRGESQGGGECLAAQSREFTCNEFTGVTLFEIAEGRTEFFVQPICDDGLPAAANTFQSPDSIVRTVREGEIVTLNSLLIVVSEPGESCQTNCTCVRE